MRGSKAGLSDLKRLHGQAQALKHAAQAHEKARLAAAPQPASSTALSEDAVKLFARAIQTVQPIRAKGRVQHPRMAAQSDIGSTAANRTASPAVLAQSNLSEQLAQKRLRATGEHSHVPVTSMGKETIGISDLYAPILDTGNDVAWAASGIGPDTQRRLKLGLWPVGAHLDLHGMTTDQARPALLDFLALSQQHNTRCVRIVHGQGFGSPHGEAVLRQRVIQWLTQIPAVVAFATAPQAHGGRGALLVLIRQS